MKVVLVKPKEEKAWEKRLCALMREMLAKRVKAHG